METITDIPDWLHNLVVYHKGQWPGGEHIYTNNGACTRSYYMQAVRLITGEPSDSEAPDWANWKAQDWNGDWAWFSEKPHTSQEQSIWDSSDQVLVAGFGSCINDWRDTLKPVNRSIDRRPIDEYEQRGWDEHQARTQKHDAVNHPEHYASGDIECIDAIRASMTPDELAGYLKGNTQKYIWRYRQKGGAQDLAKAKWYLERLEEHVGAHHA